MVRIHLADAIQRHVPCPPTDVEGATVRDVLDALFQKEERLRGYVLDDQGALRQHVAVFVDGTQIHDPRGLSDPVPARGRVDVMQALSGG